MCDCLHELIRKVLNRLVFRDSEDLWSSLIGQCRELVGICGEGVAVSLLGAIALKRSCGSARESSGGDGASGNGNHCDATLVRGLLAVLAS